MAKILIEGEKPGKFKQSLIDETFIYGVSAKDDFDMASNGITELILSFDLTPTDDIDVWVNGSLVREGALESYTLDDVANKVIFNSSLKINDWIRVRRY